MTDPARSFALDRSGWMRVGGGPLLQPIFVLAFVIWLIEAVHSGDLILLIIPAVAAVLWIIGATAWVRVDESGIHRRCWLPRSDSWTDISRIELHTTSFGYNSARRTIRVHREHGWHTLTPATGNGRRTEEFGRRLVGAARARGVHVSVSGWGGFEE